MNAVPQQVWHDETDTSFPSRDGRYGDVLTGFDSLANRRRSARYTVRLDPFPAQGEGVWLNVAHGIVRAAHHSVGAVMRKSGLHGLRLYVPDDYPSSSPLGSSSSTFIFVEPQGWDARSAPTIEVLDEPSPEDKLHAELLSYLELPHGWDGFDGAPASPEAVVDALTFLALRPSDIPLPHPQVSPDGEVGLYWRTAEVYAEISFSGDRTFAYFARYEPATPSRERLEDGRDDCPVDAEKWPEQLLIILNKLPQPQR